MAESQPGSGESQQQTLYRDPARSQRYYRHTQVRGKYESSDTVGLPVVAFHYQMHLNGLRGSGCHS